MVLTNSIQLMHHIIFPYALNLVLNAEKDLFTVRSAILDAKAKWQYIGEALGLSPGFIAGIHTSGPDPALSGLTTILTEWMQRSKNASIYKLLAALEDPTVGRTDIADKIRSSI